MEFYLKIRRLVNGTFAAAAVSNGIPTEIGANERVIKVDLDVDDESFAYPTVKIVWPSTPVQLPPHMVEDLKEWSGDQQPT